MRRNRPVTFKVLSVGVNGDDLRFAQKDAIDIGLALSGATGLVGPEDVTCLLEATLDELRAALLRLSIEQPAFLVFSFSGHGSPTGVVLADGEMSFVELARWLRRVNSHATLTVLDSCYSGGYIAVGGTSLGALDVDALEILMRSVPGNRIMCSVAADRLAGEGRDVANGHLTAALLSAMRLAKGDLDGRRGRMISDRRLFGIARSIARRRWGQTPVGRGLLGDFPVVRAEDKIVGDVAIVGAGIVEGTFQATFDFHGRRGLPTVIVVDARGLGGAVLKGYRNVVVATEDVDCGVYLYPISADDIFVDEVSVASMDGLDRAPVRWTISVLDGRGRVLAEGYRDVAYEHALSSYLRVGW